MLANYEKYQVSLAYPPVGLVGLVCLVHITHRNRYVHTYIYMYMHIHTYICMYIYMYIHTYIYVHTCIYMYICTFYEPFKCDVKNFRQFFVITHHCHAKVMKSYTLYLWYKITLQQHSEMGAARVNTHRNLLRQIHALALVQCQCSCSEVSSPLFKC